MAIENAILEAVLKRSKGATKQGDMDQDREDFGGVRDRVEDLISSIVGLEHIKCQVRASSVVATTFHVCTCSLTKGALSNHSIH